MTYDFETYLRDKLTRIAIDLEFRDLKIYVSEEQMFNKMDKMTPDTIYVVVKYLSSDIQYDAETMPIQILVLSEQNSLEKTQMILNKFANDNNWQVITGDGLYIKQQYNSPVVLNNYAEVGYGYRSVLYITGTLFIMENVVDVKNVYIDYVSGDEPYKPLNFSIAYSMATNTQQLSNDKFIATSLKTVSTFSISMMIPMLESKLVTKVINILNETDNTDIEGSDGIAYDGNNSFDIQFDCGITIHKPYMRLISVQIISAPNQVPSLQLGFME